MRHGHGQFFIAANPLLSGQRISTSLEIGASVLLHAALLAMLFHGLDAPPETPKERSVSVDIISAAQYAAAVAATQLTAPTARTEVAQPAPVPVEPPPVEPAPPPPAEVTEPSGMVHATQLKAAGVLAEPGSKEIRETLPLLGGDERKVQLCNIEALAQIHAADSKLDPDILVAYAMADMDVSANGVTADGGAFRSKQQWYGFKFRCDVSADLKSVTDFSFAIGEPIPKSEWESHDLTADDQDMD